MKEKVQFIKIIKTYRKEYNDLPFLSTEFIIFTLKMSPSYVFQSTMDLC